MGSISLHAVTLLDTSTAWNYLHPLDATDPVSGVDPSTGLANNAFADADFQSTWFTSGFDDSAWQTGTESFGYGGIDFFAGAANTDIGTPSSGDRYTAYFRADFTAATAVNNLSLSLLADDGAFIYIDGVKVAVLNFASTSENDTYLATAPGNGNDDNLTVIDLSSLVGTLAAGSHTVAISVHQVSSTSSDLGFQASLEADAVPEASHFGLLLGSAVLLFVSRRRR